jgi:hypothetical protein
MSRDGLRCEPAGVVPEAEDPRVSFGLIPHDLEFGFGEIR